MKILIRYLESPQKAGRHVDLLLNAGSAKCLEVLEGPVAEGRGAEIGNAAKDQRRIRERREEEHSERGRRRCRRRGIDERADRVAANVIPNVDTNAPAI